jgi:hypothetical protein
MAEIAASATSMGSEFNRDKSAIPDGSEKIFMVLAPVLPTAPILPG